MGMRQAAPATSSGQGFYTWLPPDNSLSIDILFDVIDGMLPDVMRGFGALPRRGAEVGGILIGQVDPDSPRRIVIEDFEPVPCEYSTGPSYHLSERDLFHLEEALQMEESRGRTVVGWYRSHTRKDLFLDSSDLELAARYFSNPPQVILLIHPFASRTSAAGFFYWEDGRIHAESSYHLFPFHSRELSGADPEPVVPLDAGQSEVRYPDGIELPTPPGKPPLISGLPAPFRSPLSVARTLKAPAWMGAALTPVLAGVLSVGGYVLYQRIAPAPQTIPRLNLGVSDSGGQLEVHWNGGLPLLASVVRGTLAIQDGPSYRNFDLTTTQLRDGRIRYPRLTQDVRVRLELFTGERNSLTETARLPVSGPLSPPGGGNRALTPLPASGAGGQPPPTAAGQTAPPQRVTHKRPSVRRVKRRSRKIRRKTSARKSGSARSRARGTSSRRTPATRR